MLKKYTMPFLLLAAMGGSASQAIAADSTAVAKGQDVFKQRCLHCHGENADGTGHLREYLKITPANLTELKQNGNCVTDKVLKAVLGRHTTDKHNMPLLKDYLSPEEIFFISEYIKSKQK